MIPKSGDRFSEKIMPKQESVVPKSGDRFSTGIVRKIKHDPQKPAPHLMRGGRRLCDSDMLDRQEPLGAQPMQIQPPRAPSARLCY